MELVWQIHAWEDYMYWVKNDREMMRSVHILVTDCQRRPFIGYGAPIPLKGIYTGYWSRKIRNEHRLIYTVKDQRLHILQCRYVQLSGEAATSSRGFLT